MRLRLRSLLRLLLRLRLRSLLRLLLRLRLRRIERLLLDRAAPASASGGLFLHCGRLRSRPLPLPLFSVLSRRSPLYPRLSPDGRRGHGRGDPGGQLVQPLVERRQLLVHQGRKAVADRP